MDFYARTGKDAVSPFVPAFLQTILMALVQCGGFSGNNTTDDATGNETPISNYWQFSTTQKKWR